MIKVYHPALIPHTTHFANVVSGDTFIFEGEIYISNGTEYPVNLSNPARSTFINNTREVQLIDVELTYKLRNP